MGELSQLHARTIEQPVSGARNLAKASDRAMDVLFGAQRLALDELILAGTEMLERANAETHLFSEFVSKMAEAHSVRNIRSLYEECGKHQIDFIRRDAERIFKHGERTIERVAGLLSGSASGSVAADDRRDRSQQTRSTIAA
jgi:hypothetical protein